MILVTGATGRVGYRLMEALADAGADATAMVRVEARAADLPGAPRHVVASFDDPPPAEILRGFDRVFLLSPVHEEQAAMETVFIDALAVAGHRPHIGSSPGSGGLTLAGWLGAGSGGMVVIRLSSPSCRRWLL